MYPTFLLLSDEAEVNPLVEVQGYYCSKTFKFTINCKKTLQRLYANYKK